MRMIWPTGLASPKRFSTTVAPSTATLVAALTSSSVKNEPLATAQARIVG